MLPAYARLARKFSQGFVDNDDTLVEDFFQLRSSNSPLAAKGIHPQPCSLCENDAWRQQGKGIPNNPETDRLRVV